MSKTNNTNKLKPISMSELTAGLVNDPVNPIITKLKNNPLKDHLPESFFTDFYNLRKFNPNDRVQMKSLVATISHLSSAGLRVKYGDDVARGYENVLRVIKGIEEVE